MELYNKLLLKIALAFRPGYWKGFLVHAVDGSTAYLFNKKEVREYFGCHTNQHEPGHKEEEMPEYFCCLPFGERNAFLF